MQLKLHGHPQRAFYTDQAQFIGFTPEFRMDPLTSRVKVYRDGILIGELSFK